MNAKFLIHTKCNFCGNKSREVIHELGRQKMVRCKKCYLIYLDKQRRDLSDIYNEDYFSSGDNNTTANYANYQSLEKTTKKNFSFAYQVINKNFSKKMNKLLEIGPGFGYFLKYLPKAIIAESSEVSHEAVINLKQQGFRVYEGNFMKFNSKTKYDFIVGFDVIEHQLYLKEFIKKVNSFLNKDGLFIFTTPDIEGILNRLFGKRAPAVQPLYHNYYFTKSWILDNFPSLGFEIVSIKTIHLTYLSIGQILLLASFPFPVIKRLNLKKLRLESKIIPFIRFGGIQCVIKKT